MKNEDKIPPVRILYLMHVSWGWIKQRPHFLAKYLSNYYDVTVCWKRTFKRRGIVRNPVDTPLKTKVVHVLPFKRYTAMERLSSMLVRWQMKSTLNSFDVVWVTHPSWYENIGAFIPENAIVVYDCMDDALEFPHVLANPEIRKRTYDTEKALLARCDVTLVSSRNLKAKLCERYQRENDIHVINNALPATDLVLSTVLDAPKYIRMICEGLNGKKILMYVGTIAEWVDFDLLLESLRVHQDVAYLMVGPLEDGLPKHDRIIHVPPVEHRFVQPILQLADALVMPFKITELIKSVNPVKLYEYLASCKTVITVASEETEQFARYVYSYENREEYLHLLGRLSQNDLPPRRSCSECREFVSLHTWDVRGSEINSILKKKLLESPRRHTRSHLAQIGNALIGSAVTGASAASARMILPNFFIVGAAKAGTTSLYEYLRQHPQVYMSPIKEPNHFSSDIDTTEFTWKYRSRVFTDIRAYFKRKDLEQLHAAHITDPGLYARLFKSVEGKQVRGEASVSYLYSRTAARNIKEAVPDAKVVIILRDPVDRAYSHYLMDMRDGMTYLPFRKALEQDMARTKKGWGISHLYVELGMYSEQVRRYRDAFDDRHLRIYLYEDMRNTEKFFRDLFEFLQIDAGFMPDVRRKHNVAQVPVHARMNYILKSGLSKIARMFTFDYLVEIVKNLLISSVKPQALARDDREYLRSLFRDDVEKLGRLINRDLSGWMGGGSENL